MDRHTRHLTGSVGNIAVDLHNSMTPRERRGIGFAIGAGFLIFVACILAMRSLTVHLGNADQVRSQLIAGSWLTGTLALLAPWTLLIGVLSWRLRRGRGSRKALLAGLAVTLVAILGAQAHNGILSEIAYAYANPQRDRGLALSCPGWIADNPALVPGGRLNAYACRGYVGPTAMDTACLRILAPLRPISGDVRLMCHERAAALLPQGAYWPEDPRVSYEGATGLRDATLPEMRGVILRLKAALLEHRD